MTSPKVLYLATESWYFANHRLDHARALIDAGFEVHVATRRGDRWGEVAEAGCVMHEIDIERGSGTPGTWLSETRTLRRLVRNAQPGVVHAVALKPVALALTLIVAWRRPSLILSVNGLGISAAHPGRSMTLIRAAIRLAARVPRVQLLFQTQSDRQSVLGRSDRGVVIPGVGVDTDRFVPRERPKPPPIDVVYMGRAVVSKGLVDLADAALLRTLPGVRIRLYLAIDSTSPGALGDDDLAKLHATEGIEVFPATTRPEDVLGRAHAAILPSRAGEGVSKFVLEALACGAPVLISAESGSGEVIDPGVTGLLFEAGNLESIRDSLAEIAAWPQDRWERARLACRSAATSAFSVRMIAPQIVALHRASLPGGMP